MHTSSFLMTSTQGNFIFFVAPCTVWLMLLFCHVRDISIDGSQLAPPDYQSQRFE